MVHRCRRYYDLPHLPAESRQILQIIQILVAAGGALVLPEVIEIDKTDGFAVEIARRPGMAVESDRVSPDDEILNPLLVEQPQEFSEVVW